MDADGSARLVTRQKGGRSWRIGSDVDVAWIRAGTFATKAVTSAIPPLFDAYATVELPTTEPDHRTRIQQRHERALLALLTAHAQPQSWWLGYLDTGADDLVFPDAPQTTLYAGWKYVIVEAGPPEAATWRLDEPAYFWKGTLPNLLFPADHCWLVSTLWDDDWTCIGGTQALVDQVLGDPELGPRTRQVSLDQDGTPPGHTAW
ncbi:hypothetical protein [Nakamurella lactea]|uniref:hypothetical protein n=1 Tax=Nakamurella lactea TaxID=459515 RepID=UPI00040BA1CA|nr:hypothetical protein [Nakamurella lactea]